MAATVAEPTARVIPLQRPGPLSREDALFLAGLCARLGVDPSAAVFDRHIWDQVQAVTAGGTP